jgi:ABC-2 type transport system ATP-binding protein
VLFLDEPTTGLDPQSRRALWTEIRRLRDDGVTVFLTTQYLEEADELADRVAIVDHGAIIAEGTSASLKAAQGRTTIAVEHSGTLDQLRAALDGAGRGAALEATGSSRAEIRLGSAAEGSEILAILDRLRRQGPEIRHLSVRETSLEDVLLNLTGTSIVIGSDQAQAGAGK